MERKHINRIRYTNKREIELSVVISLGLNILINSLFFEIYSFREAFDLISNKQVIESWIGFNWELKFPMMETLMWTFIEILTHQTANDCWEWSNRAASGSIEIWTYENPFFLQNPLQYLFSACTQISRIYHQPQLMQIWWKKINSNRYKILWKQFSNLTLRTQASQQILKKRVLYSS